MISGSVISNYIGSHNAYVQNSIKIILDNKVYL
jgi:hypothetical protein